MKSLLLWIVLESIRQNGFAIASPRRGKLSPKNLHVRAPIVLSIGFHRYLFSSLCCNSSLQRCKASTEQDAMNVKANERAPETGRGLKNFVDVGDGPPSTGRGLVSDPVEHYIGREAFRPRVSPNRDGDLVPHGASIR